MKAPAIHYCPVTGKLSYPTPQAGARAMHAKEKQPGRKRGWEVYRCKHCHEFHATSHEFIRNRRLKNKGIRNDDATDTGG